MLKRGVNRLNSSRIPIAKPKRILFMGGDRVSLASLQRIHQHLASSDNSCSSSNLTVMCPPVIHQRSAASMASHHPIALYCEQHNIPHHIVQDPKVLKKEEVLGSFLEQQTQHSAFDLAIVVSFRYFLPNWFLNAMPPCINMHPSLLPKYRGASPIYHTLLGGETTGGVSIIKIAPNELMDCGDVLCQRTLDVPPTMTVREYEPLVVETGAQLLLQTVFSGSLDVLWEQAQVQPDKRRAVDDPFGAPKVDRRMCGRLDFHQMDGFVAYNVWRGFVGHFQVFCSMNKLATPVGERIKDPSKAIVRVIVKEALHFSQLPHEAQLEFAGSRLMPLWSEEHKCTLVVNHEGHHQQHGDVKKVGTLSRSIPPGSCYFFGKQLQTTDNGNKIKNKNKNKNKNKTDAAVMGIKCTRGWLFCSELTLNNGVSQSVETLRKAMCFRRGVAYAGVFAKADGTQ